MNGTEVLFQLLTHQKQEVKILCLLLSKLLNESKEDAGVIIIHVGQFKTSPK